MRAADDGEETVIIRFDRNGTEEITGGGDAQRIFATVLSAIQEYIKDYQPLRLTFSASKDVDVGQNVDSRFKLYDRMILRYANSWGYRFFRADNDQAVIYELSRLRTVAEGSEHFNGVEIYMEKNNDEIMVTAMIAGDRELGHVLFVQDGDYLLPQDLEVDERYRGQGIAATMYDFVKSKGYKIRRSGQQTDAGEAFWDKNRPGQNVWEQGVAENFADGKHPGRKGLAKRVGVNCKQPISKLRSIASNSSGEKQRMAHWCANMKSGKKK